MEHPSQEHTGKTMYKTNRAKDKAYNDCSQKKHMIFLLSYGLRVHG